MQRLVLSFGTQFIGRFQIGPVVMHGGEPDICLRLTRSTTGAVIQFPYCAARTDGPLLNAEIGPA